MDRLVCGDVVLKTEVAIRAAFKAADDSKQVAVLVPTTILAYQHQKHFQKIKRIANKGRVFNVFVRPRTEKQSWKNFIR